MSDGVKGGGGGGGSVIRVTIPSGVKKTIENIKEITGQNHTEDEIYAMLKECSMDPNETTQKLLLLDTFHEVKRKRYKKKENLIKEPVEPKWKTGTQARANRASRGNYSTRYASHGGGRNLPAAKENATVPLIEKGTNKAPLAPAQVMKKNETLLVASPSAAISDGPSDITYESVNVIYENHASASGGVKQSNVIGNTSMSKLEGPIQLSPLVDSSKPFNALETGDIQQHQMLDSSNPATSIPSAPAPGSYFCSSDPVLLPSQDLPLHSAVGTIRRGVGSQRTPVELIGETPAKSKPSSVRNPASDVGSAILKQKMPNNFQKDGKNHHVEPMEPDTSAVAVSVSTVSRPSSNYNNRSQVIGPQKVGPGKEWKPKSTNPSIGQGATTAAPSEVPMASIGSHSESQKTPVGFTLKEDTLDLQRKLEESHVSDRQHVIIPNHLHVPEAEKLGFSFGSFDASFGLDLTHIGVPGSDKNPPSSEVSEARDEPVKELQLSNQNALEAAEDTQLKYPDQPYSPVQGPESFSSGEAEVQSSITPEYGEAKQEVAPEIHQHPVTHTSSNYNFGFMPHTPSGQLTPLESSESQARDAPRLPGFVVQQSFDPASYYAQFYRGLDNDGRISPFHSAGVANKYNGNAAAVSQQTSQSPQELQGGVPLVLPTATPTPLVTQAAGVMQSSIQQPLPVFRHPSGVHLPHYPPNYIPYGPYFSPFYVPPPAIHQFLSNGTFPQQPQAGNLYPTPPGATAKYSVSQYKQGANAGNSTHVGVPGSYGPYGLSMANYTSSSATADATPTSNEDLAAPQVKENNIYVGGQQSEGSGVWFTTPGRDISTMQASSFYNLPQGQLAFAPTQSGHGAFTGMFHPAQAVTAGTVHPLLQQSQPITSPADMVGPAPSVYQQQQHAQFNWPSNY